MSFDSNRNINSNYYKHDNDHHNYYHSPVNQKKTEIKSSSSTSYNKDTLSFYLNDSYLEKYQRAQDLIAALERRSPQEHSSIEKINYWQAKYDEIYCYNLGKKNGRKQEIEKLKEVITRQQLELTQVEYEMNEIVKREELTLVVNQDLQEKIMDKTQRLNTTGRKLHSKNRKLIETDSELRKAKCSISQCQDELKQACKKQRIEAEQALNEVKNDKDLKIGELEKKYTSTKEIYETQNKQLQEKDRQFEALQTEFASTRTTLKITQEGLIKVEQQFEKVKQELENSQQGFQKMQITCVDLQKECHEQKELSEKLRQELKASEEKLTGQTRKAEKLAKAMQRALNSYNKANGIVKPKTKKIKSDKKK